MFSTNPLLVFLFLIPSEGLTLRTDFVSSPEESTRQFIRSEIMESRKLVKSDLLSFLTNLTKTIETINHQLMDVSRNQQKISCHQQISYAQQKSFPTNNIITLMKTSGLISYDKKLTSFSNRRFWILKNTTAVRFTVEHIIMDSTADLIFTGISPKGVKDEISINSSKKKKTQFTVEGFVIVVTLVLKDISSNTHPDFKIKYNKLNRASDSRQYATKVTRVEGLEVVSLPEDNEGEYPSNASFMWLIAPLCANPFELSLKFIETEDITNCKSDYLGIFSLLHPSTSSKYELQGRPEQKNMYCGRNGEINPPEFIGYSSASILFFSSDNIANFKGFKVQIKTLDLQQELSIFS